jgi:hypothetical protein
MGSHKLSLAGGVGAEAGSEAISTSHIARDNRHESLIPAKILLNTVQLKMI